MKLNRLDQSVQGPVLMPAHYVNVPYIRAFAGKEGKEWYVYELATGLKVTAQPGATREQAVKIATERLLSYGKELTLEAIKTKGIINNEN